VDTLHDCMSGMWLRFRSEGGWKEENFFSFCAVDGGACVTLIGDNVISNKSARVDRVNECFKTYRVPVVAVANKCVLFHIKWWIYC